jgi:hypothetical protein
VSTSTSIGLAPVKHKSSNTSEVGAIAGGTVGGVFGLILILLAAWFIAKGRKHNDFDGDFDPDSVGGPARRGDRQSLVPDGPTGTEVTPYVFQDRPRDPKIPQMGEYGSGNSTALVAGGANYGATAQQTQTFSNPSDGGYPQSERSYPPNAYLSSSGGSDYAYGQEQIAGVNNEYAPQALTQATSSDYSQYSQPRSAKEREALTQRFGATGGPSQRPLLLVTSSEESTSPILVHQ